MPYPPPNPLLNSAAIYEVRARYWAPSVYDQGIVWTQHYRATADPLPFVSRVQDLLLAFRNLWRSNVLTNQLNTTIVGDYQVRSITGSVVSPVTGLQKLVYTDLIVLPGDAVLDKGTRAAAEYLPPTDTVSIEWRSGLAKRNGFGCMRLGFIPEADVDSGVVNVGGRARYQEIADSMSQDLTLEDNEVVFPVIFTKKAYLSRADLLISPSDFAREIFLTDVSPITGTQRTRKRGIRTVGI